jgi:CRP-like cAMP-binding protein
VTVGALETNEPGLGDAALEVALDGALHEAGDRAALRLRRLEEAGPPALGQRMQDAPARVPWAVGLDALLHELEKGQPRAATKGLGIERDLPFLAELAQRIRVERYPDGDVILQRGHPGHAFYVVQDGTLEVIGFAEDQVSSVVSRLRERDCFGEMSILTGAPVAATVVARGPVTLYALEKADFEQILRDNPFMAARFTRLLASRLLAANYLLAKETQKTFAGKLATMNFAAVLQTLADSQRSGTLRLRHPAGAEAELGFAGGRIFTARLGELTGELAVYALCAWDAGEFALEPTPVPATDLVQVGVINLLLEGMRRLDEAEVVSAVPMGDPG